jgi:hypothetical protein
MSEFLRPETLFGKQKFGGYYDTRDLPVEPAVNNPTGKPTFVRIQELEACIEVHPANRNWIGFVEEKATPEFREDLLAKRRELAGLRKGVQ